MKNLSFILFFGLYSILASSQEEYTWNNCGENSLSVETSYFSKGDSFVVYIIPEKYATLVEYTIDFYTYLVPDRLDIIDNGVRYSYGWIGFPQYLSGIPAIEGYLEFYNHQLILSGGFTDVPSDFYFGKGGFRSSFRSVFISSSDTIKIVIISNPEMASKMNIFVHCTFGLDPSYIPVVEEKIEKDCYIPNAFSPNGDGINDEFYPSNCDCNYMEIFDRWGNLMYSGVIVWTGIDCNPGIYVYKIKTESNKTYFGEINLIK